MLNGLDTIDWAALEDCYGPATEVPDLLQAMRSADPEVRGQAGDELWDRVHCEGYVNECTVACVPFLLEIIDRDGADHCLMLHLLASICGVAGEGYVVWDPGDDAAGDLRSLYDRARTAVAARLPRLLPRLDDESPGIRQALLKLVAACAGHTGDPLPLFRQRFATEPDPRLRTEVVLAAVWAGRIRWAAGRPGDVVTWLAALAADNPDPLGALELLTSILDADPTALPGRIVPAALRLMRKLDAEGYPLRSDAPGFRVPDVFDADGSGSEHRLGPEAEARHRAADPTWWNVGLLVLLTRGLAARMAERTELALAMMASPRWFVRQAGCGCAVDAVRWWRGDFRELLTGLLARRHDPDPRVREAVAVESIGAAIAPVAGLVLAEYSGPAADGSDPAVQDNGSGGRYVPWELAAVAATGDPRIEPVLRRILQRETRPVFGVPGMLTSLGEHAAGLLDAILPYFAGLVALPGGAPDWYLLDLALALGAIGAPAAPATADLVAALEAGVPAWRLLPVFGRIGPGAAVAVPHIRPYLTAADGPVTPLRAAGALWRITGDPEPALAVLAQTFATAPAVGPWAAELAAELGPPAARFLPHLQRMAQAEDRPGWELCPIGAALWRITGQPEPAVAVLVRSARSGPGEHIITVADRLAEIGPAARDAVPVLRGFVSAPGQARRRVVATPDPALDHRIAAASARALERIEPVT